MTNKTLYTDGDVAQICWAANAALMRINGDPHADGPWEDLSETVKTSCVLDVHLARRNPTTAREMHAEWCRRKEAQGWTWGEVRDPEAKTHPSIVEDYEDVPEREQAKDALWLGIIAAFPPKTNASKG